MYDTSFHPKEVIKGYAGTPPTGRLHARSFVTSERIIGEEVDEHYSDAAEGAADVFATNEVMIALRELGYGSRSQIGAGSRGTGKCRGNYGRKFEAVEQGVDPIVIAETHTNGSPRQDKCRRLPSAILSIGVGLGRRHRQDLGLGNRRMRTNAEEPY